MDLHQLAQLATQLNNDLGRPPGKMEMINAGATWYSINKHGGMSGVLSAAGIEMEKQGRKKQPAPSIFQRDIQNHLETYSPRELPPQVPLPKILCIPDTHFPFVNTQALERLISFSEKMQPDYIIQVGDLFDCYAASKFPRSLNVYTPKEEERLARDGADDMWAKLIAGSPKATCYQLLGNHDVRMVKRTLEALPQAEHWIEKYMLELFSFDGVKTIMDTREELEIAGILFTHGFLGKGAHKDYYIKNVVHGHDHKLYVDTRRIHGQNVFEMSCGFLGDVESKALSYTSSKSANYQIGFGYIDEYGPRVIYL